MSILKFSEFINECEYIRNDFLLNEGGGYGHLSHPFEDWDLEMGDLYNMIDLTIKGAFTPQNFIQEKTDGLQLSISWKNGKLIAARNKGQLKNFGEKALDIFGIQKMFSGRGDIEKAFVLAMTDLNNIFSQFSESDKEKYFNNGQKFASLEIITPYTQVTVPYGLNMLVFHGVIEYDENGIAIGEDKQAGIDLGNIIKDINADTQEHFYVRGPNNLEIKPLPNTQNRETYYKNKYKQILKDSEATDKTTIGEYVIKRCIYFLNIELSKDNIEFDNETLIKLTDRILGKNKTYSVNEIKKNHGVDGIKYLDIEKAKSNYIKIKSYEPIELLILEIGTEFMKNMSSFLTSNPTNTTLQMKDEIDSTIKDIKKEGNEEALKRLERQLERATAIGGLESIMPTEGITFMYKNKMYKFTGIWAPVHQIRSILTFKK